MESPECRHPAGQAREISEASYRFSASVRAGRTHTVRVLGPGGRRHSGAPPQEAKPRCLRWLLVLGEGAEA